MKFTLTKARRKDEFGIELGCKFYIKEIRNRKLSEKEPGLKEGDSVLKINGQLCDDLSLSDAKKLLQKYSDKLTLVVQRDVPRGSSWRWPSQSTLYEQLGPYAGSSRGSPTPAGTPLLANSSMRLSGRFNRLAASEYIDSTSSPTPRASRMMAGGSQPASRARTPSHGQDYYSAGPNGQPVVNGYTNATGQPLPVHSPRSPILVPQDANVAGSDYVTYSSKPPLPVPMPDPRYVNFHKEHGSVGIRVIGGNEVGIFVSAVQPTSPAAVRGVRPGDKILRVSKLAQNVELNSLIYLLMR